MTTENTKTAPITEGDKLEKTIRTIVQQEIEKSFRQILDSCNSFHKAASSISQAESDKQASVHG